MALVASQPSVTSSATLIADATDTDNQRGVSVLMKNTTATATVFLGGSSSVTTGNGYGWAAADGPITMNLEAGEALYGIVASVTQVVHVLKQGG